MQLPEHQFVLEQPVRVTPGAQIPRGNGVATHIPVGKKQPTEVQGKAVEQFGPNAGTQTHVYHNPLALV